MLVLASFLVVGLCSSQAATLIGVVVDQSDAVIPGASISIYSGSHEWRTETNGRGAFQVVLPAGTCDVEVAEYGFRKRIIKSLEMGHSDRSIRVTLDVASPGDDCFAARVTYDNAGGEVAIQGLVRGKGNSALPGVKISISTEHDPAAGFLRSRTVAVTRTNQKGEFDFPNLSPGLYRLEASRKGYAGFTSANLRVRLGEAAQVDFSMHPSDVVVLCQ